MKYVFEHNLGRAVNANTGKPAGILRRFDTESQAAEFVADYEPPNHCPQAFAEIVNRRDIRPLLPKQNAAGEWSDQWIPSEDGSHEYLNQ